MSTAPQGWQPPKTNWQAADIVHPSDFNRIEGNIQAIETGQRTLDPTQAPSGNQGTLRQMLDWFANRIRAITGGTNWWDAPATTLAAAAAHAARTDNPHGVTKAQVGLGNVENYGIATQAEAEAGTATNKYMTPLRVAQAIAALHANRRDNPHNVQAQQVPYSSSVSGFTPSTVKAALDSLAGARIVEMGSNSNGEYVRWENGWQVCFVRGVAFSGDGRSDEKTGSWTHPAAFASPPAIVGRNAEGQASPIWHLEVNPGTGPSMIAVAWRAYRASGPWSQGTNYHLHYIAIGRWK